MTNIKHLITIRASRKAVYEALATEHGLKQWWTADSRTDDHEGGKAEFGFENRGVVFRMNIEKLEPGEKVIWTCHGDHPEWDGTTLTWIISADEEGTTLRFEQSNWKEYTDFCADCNSMWGNLLYRMKDYLEGKGRGPQWKE